MENRYRLGITTVIFLMCFITTGCDDKKKTPQTQPKPNESDQEYENTYGPDGIFDDLDLVNAEYATSVSNCNDVSGSNYGTIADAFSSNLFEKARPYENWYLKGDNLFAFIEYWEQLDDHEADWETGLFIFNLTTGQAEAFRIGQDARLQLSDSGWLWAQTNGLAFQGHHGIFEPPTYTDALPHQWEWSLMLYQEGIIDIAPDGLMTTTAAPYLVGDYAILGWGKEDESTGTTSLDYYAYDTVTGEIRDSRNVMGTTFKCPHFPRDYEPYTVFYAPEIDSYMKILKPQLSSKFLEVAYLDHWDFQILSTSEVAGDTIAAESPESLTLSHDREKAFYWDNPSKSLGFIDLQSATASELAMSAETDLAPKSLISNGEHLQVYDRAGVEYRQYDLTSGNSYEVGPCKWSAVDDEKAVCIDFENRRLLIHEFSWNTNTFHALDYSCSL